jgi:protein TonB
MEHQLTQRVALILKEVSMSKRRVAVSLVTISILLFITGLTASRYLPLTTEAAGHFISGERFIGGDVYDQAGAVIPGAAVKLIDKNTGQVLESAISDSSGHFEVKRPDQGEFTLRIEYPGFKPALYDQTSAPQGNIRVTLALGQIQETVKVRADSVDARAVSAVSAALRPSSAGTKRDASSQEPEKHPIRVSQATQAAKALKTVQPVYPEVAKQAGVTGTVVLEVTINEAGDVSNIIVVSGHQLLRDAAAEAAKQWKFSPSYLNGDPISVVANLSFNFALAENKAGLSLTMDDAGNLLEGEQRLEGERLNARIAESEGSIRIRPNPKVPLKVVEETLQILQRLAGDRPVRLSAPYAFRDGHLTKSEPIRVGGNVQASKLLNRVSPIYPKEAKEAGVEGTVVLQITVSEAGEVSDIQVVSGHELLRDASVEAVKQWRYSPTLLNGEPVPVIATVTVQFALK